MADTKQKVPNLRFKGFTDPWGERKLGDITTWTKGQGLSKEYLNNERYGSEAVHYADLYKFSPVMQEVIHWTNSDDGRIIPDNSLLFPASDVTPVGLARTSTLRLSGVKAGGDVIIGQLSERINSSFMSYQINANSKKILPLITGTTVKHVQAKSLATMSVTITNMAEQAAIAGLFERIDKLIALQQRKLDLLKQLKKGLLQKMFADQDRKQPVLRFKGFHDDWEQRKLGDEYKHIGNAFVGTASPYYTQNGYFYLESNNIKNGQINHDHEVFINESFYHKQLNKLLHTGDLVMVQSGHVGDTAVITEKYNGTAAHALIMFRKPKNNMLSFFLNSFFQSSNAKNRIDVLAIGNTIRHILASDMKKFVVYLPDNKEKGEVAKLFLELQKLISLQHQKLAKYQSVKKSLLQQMFI